MTFSISADFIGAQNRKAEAALAEDYAALGRQLERPQRQLTDEAGGGEGQLSDQVADAPRHEGAADQGGRPAGEAGARRRKPVDLLAQAALELAPVGEVGQRIVRSLP